MGSKSTPSASTPPTRFLPPLPSGSSNENPKDIGIIGLIAEDFRTHESDLFSQGFWAVAVHRFGNWRMGFSLKICRAPLTLIYRILYKIVEWTCGITLPYTTKLGRRVHIWHHSGIILSARSVGSDCHIRQNTTLGVRVRDQNLAIPVIEDHVDIGVGVCILGDVRVGHNSVIGANSVVVTDIPPYSIAVGAPAKVVKTVTSARDLKPA